MLTCDRRIAADNATLGVPEILLGIIPGGGGTQRLARLIGPARAKDMVFTGRFVRADEALAIGLVDELVPAADVYARARAYVEPFAHGPALAYAAAKKAIDGGLDVDLRTGLDIESDQFAGLFATDDQRIGMASFVEHGPGKATVHRKVSRRPRRGFPAREPRLRSPAAAGVRKPGEPERPAERGKVTGKSASSGSPGGAVAHRPRGGRARPSPDRRGDGGSMGTSEPVTVVVLGAGPAAPPGVHVLAHADEPRHAPRLVAAARPQVVLVGLGRDRDAVLAVVSELTVRVPDARVLAVSGTGDPAADVLAAVRAGASGYLVTADDPEALADAVRRTAGGRGGVQPGAGRGGPRGVRAAARPRPVAPDRA